MLDSIVAAEQAAHDRVPLEEFRAHVADVGHARSGRTW